MVFPVEWFYPKKSTRQKDAKEIHTKKRRVIFLRFLVFFSYNGLPCVHTNRPISFFVSFSENDSCNCFSLREKKKRKKRKIKTFFSSTLRSRKWYRDIFTNFRIKRLYRKQTKKRKICFQLPRVGKTVFFIINKITVLTKKKRRKIAENL